MKNFKEYFKASRMSKRSKMPKGQSLILQFVMFFIIGFTIFVSVSQFFRLQSDIFKDDVTRESLKLYNTYFSSLALTAANSCKQCDYVNITVKTSNTTAGQFFEISFGSYGVNVTVPLIKRINFVTSAHNLNETYQTDGLVASSRPITLTFNKTQNKIGIS